MQDPRRTGIVVLLTVTLLGCGREQRPLSAGPPLTPPSRDAEDPRIPRYQDNRYEVSQGGRYFVWYGCTACHAETDTLASWVASRSSRGAAFAEVYEAIGHGHGDGMAFAERIPTEQLWQLTAYVRSLPDQEPAMRRRQAHDLAAEPQGTQWRGALR